MLHCINGMVLFLNICGTAEVWQFIDQTEWEEKEEFEELAGSLWCQSGIHLYPIPIGQMEMRLRNIKLVSLAMIY